MPDYLEQLLGYLDLTPAQFEYLQAIRPLPSEGEPSSISQEELNDLRRRDMITDQAPATRRLPALNYYVTPFGAGIVGAVLNQLEEGESHGMDRTPPTSDRIERNAAESADGCSTER